VSAQSVLVITWVLVGLVVAGYIWFVVWRVRAERRKKAAEAATQEPVIAALRATATDARPSGAAMDPSPMPLPPVAPPSGPAAETGTPADQTVVAALSGIRLPGDLVPLTTMAPRFGVGDRIGFWTNRTPAEIVGPAFAAELERLGYEVSPIDATSLAAHRADTRLVVVTHPDGLLATIDDKPAFPSVPERSVVVETWLAD